MTTTYNLYDIVRNIIKSTNSKDYVRRIENWFNKLNKIIKTGFEICENEIN